jgi:hypothetical protein
MTIIEADCNALYVQTISELWVTLSSQREI